MFSKSTIATILGTTLIGLVKSSKGSENRSLLKRIKNLNLIGAPNFRISTLRVYDMDGAANHRVERLEETLWSPQTGEKYVVPYEGYWRIPVPFFEPNGMKNWAITRMSEEVLEGIVETLESMDNPSLQDLYDLTTQRSEFLFNYIDTPSGSKAINQRSFKFSGILRNGITYEGQVFNASGVAINLYSKNSDQEKSPHLFIKKDGRMDEYDNSFKDSDLIGEFYFYMSDPRGYGEWGDPSFCTDPIIRLEEKFGKHPFLFEDYGYLQSGFRGYGIAKQVYNLVLEIISKSSKKPFYFCPDTCKEGATSQDMMRVWKSLSNKYINEAVHPTRGIWVFYVRPEDFREYSTPREPMESIDSIFSDFNLQEDKRNGIEFAETFNIDRPSGSANKPNRKKEFIVRSVDQGLKVIQHKDITDNWKKSLTVRPKHRVAVLLPCAATKPFAESPSHKYGYLKALGDKDVDLYVVSEPLGIIPYAWQDKYPNADYDYPPKYLKGKARELLSERIGEWFNKVYPKYEKVYSALPAHHQRLVNDSTNAKLEEVTINQCRQDTCSDNVFRATSGEYVRYLKRQVK